MKARRSSLVLAIVSAVATAATAVAAGVSAGDSMSGWIVLGDPPMGPLLMRLPAREPPGTLRRAAVFAANPALMACRGMELALIYPPERAETGEGAWRVRLIEMSADGSPVKTTPLPPVPTGATPAGVIVSGRGPVILLTNAAGRNELVRLETNQWRPIALPGEIDATVPAELLCIDDRPALWQDADQGGMAALWRMMHRTAGSDAEPWHASRMPAAGRGARLLTLDRQIVAVDRGPGGESLSFSLLRPAGRLPIASIEIGDSEHWVVASGGVISTIWRSRDAPGKLHAAVLAPMGTVLYRGPALTTPPVAGRELEWLALILGSVLLTVAVFVFRPGTLSGGAVILPPRTALAEPWRRAAAGVLDALAAVVLAWLVWRFSTGDSAGIASVVKASGARFVLLAAGAGIVASTLAEALWGRTLGKALCRCRTVDASGRKPRFSLIVLGQVLRFLCPPLGLAWLIETPHRPLRLLGLAVVVDLHADDAGPAAGPAPPEHG